MTPRVEWKSFDLLEASLRTLARQYADLPDERRDIRSAVIRAKDRARYASHNPKVAPEKRAEKEEMVRWMLVWLDSPALFPSWIELRRARLHSASM
jgi:hypothetical protein